MKILVVVDMQNDFIDGALGTKEAEAIVPKVADKIKGFDGRVIATRDTHEENYLEPGGEKASGKPLYSRNKRMGNPSGDPGTDPGTAGRQKDLRLS